MNLAMLLDILPVFIAPVILCVFSFVSAYVFRFGLPRTGIYSDYIIFAIVVAITLASGGAI